MDPRHVKRLALVGYGLIAPKHLEVFRALGCRWTAACDRSEPGRTAAAAAGIPRVYGGITEMMTAEKPDGVVCCVSFDQSAAAARELIPFRAPILLEKPPGISLGQTQELAAAASRHNTPVLAGFNRRHYSVLRRALERAGGRETITSVSVDWSEDPKHLLRRFTPEQVGHIVFANSLHGIDTLTWLAGAVPEASVQGRSLGEPFRWIMSFQGVSERGVAVSFQSNWDAPGGWRLSFCSPGKRFTFAPLETCSVRERGSPGETIIEPDEDDRRFKAGFTGQARMFLEVLASGKVPDDFKLASALPSMELAEKLTRACRTAQ